MGNILKDLRESRGLTIESAADAIGISARTLKRYEKGQFGHRRFPEKSFIEGVLYPSAKCT